MTDVKQREELADGYVLILQRIKMGRKINWTTYVVSPQLGVAPEYLCQGNSRASAENAFILRLVDDMFDK